MVFLFPTAEWLLWHPGYVLGYVLWLYGVWLTGRKALGPMLVRGDGWKGVVTVAGILFLMGVVTFLMSLTPVEFPKDPTRIGQMELHVRAMWVLLLAVLAYSIPVGMFRYRVKELTAVREADEAVQAAAQALEAKRAEAQAVTGEEIQLKSGYKTVHIPLSAIQYIEGRNNYACFHLDHREDLVSQIALKNVMDLLPEGKFIRIHRSYIVPVWRVEHSSATSLSLLGVEESLPVGRAFKDNLKNG